MRIEINAGLLDRFFNGVSTFVNNQTSTASTNRLISRLNDMTRQTNNLHHGGAQNLGGQAISSINARINMEHNRLNAIRNVQQRTTSFINTASSVDNQVAQMNRSSFDRFFEAHPWLRPRSRETIRQRVARHFNNAREAISNAWNSVVNFVQEHWQTIVAVLVVVALVVITIASFGKALPAILAIGAAIKKKAGAAIIIKAALTASKAVGKTVIGKMAKLVGAGNLGTWIGNRLGLWESKSIFDAARRIAPDNRFLNFAINFSEGLFRTVSLISLPGSIANFGGSLKNIHTALRNIKEFPNFAKDALLTTITPLFLLDVGKFIKDGVTALEAFRDRFRTMSQPGGIINFSSVINFRPMPTIFRPIPVFRPLPIFRPRPVFPPGPIFSPGSIFKPMPIRPRAIPIRA